jgi:hypothetical protein
MSYQGSAKPNTANWHASLPAFWIEKQILSCWWLGGQVGTHTLVHAQTVGGAYAGSTRHKNVLRPCATETKA